MEIFIVELYGVFFLFSCTVTNYLSLEVISELDREAQLKLEVIQTLLEPCDRATYGIRLKEAAEKLGKSKRTVQRLVKKWEEEGLAALTQTKRVDNGSHRIDNELEKFILKTYQNGNKGSKRITRKQVYLRTKIKAQELGIKAPSHMTVYRVLQPLIVDTPLPQSRRLRRV